MNNIRLILSKYGNSHRLQIVAPNPHALTNLVNRLFNRGVITTIPDDYVEGAHSNVIVSAKGDKLRGFFYDDAMAGFMPTLQASFAGKPKLSAYREGKRYYQTQANQIADAAMASVDYEALPVARRPMVAAYGESGRVPSDLAAENDAFREVSPYTATPEA